jgi:cytoskeletal protein CcmA (bactofilin family)
MFWKKRPPAVPESAPAAPEPPPERRFTDRLRTPATVIARGIRCQGEIHGGDSVEISGEFDGTIAIKGLCHVSSSGGVKGRVSATYLVVEGRVEGHLQARRKAELRPTAHVEADVHAGGVAIAEGCFFDGRIHMEGGGEGDAQRSFQEKRGGSSVDK